MLGIDQVEVGADEPVLLQGADAGKIGVILENIDRCWQHTCSIG